MLNIEIIREQTGKVCIKGFSCEFNSCIAVTEDNKVFVWGEKMGLNTAYNEHNFTVNFGSHEVSPRYTSMNCKQIKVNK